MTERVKRIFPKRPARQAWGLFWFLIAVSVGVKRAAPAPGLRGAQHARPDQGAGMTHSQGREMKGSQLPNMMHGQGQNLHPGQNLRPRQPGPFRQVRDLPPEEQERALANDERFQRLPPERQEKIRQALRHWNSLTPERKEIIRQREEIFQSLSPDQRQELRTIFPHWRRLDRSRQQELLQAFRQMRDLPPDERQRFLLSPEVDQRFSPEERSILEGLSRLLPQ